LVLHISELSTIFYGIYKIQPKVKHYLRNQLSPGYPEVSADSQPYPPLTQNTLERMQTLQCGPWGAVAGAARRNSVSSPASVAGRGQEKGSHSPRVRFRGSAGSGRWSARGCTGGGGRREPCWGAAEARLGRRGTGSCPRES
jgi:hypothetical protein